MKIPKPKTAIIQVRFGYEGYEVRFKSKSIDPYAVIYLCKKLGLKLFPNMERNRMKEFKITATFVKEMKEW